MMIEDARRGYETIISTLNTVIKGNVNDSGSYNSFLENQAIDIISSQAENLSNFEQQLSKVIQ